MSFSIMNPTKHDDNNETPKVKGKSCLGHLLINSGQEIPKFMNTNKNPFCVGIPLSREVSHSKFEEEPTYESFMYDCYGYSIYLDQSVKESSSDEQTTWKRPVCYGIWKLLYGLGAAHTAGLQALNGKVLVKSVRES